MAAAPDERRFPHELYVTSPTGEELQFVFMRPTPEELCPPLPFFIEGPTPSLENFGLAPRMLTEFDLPPFPPPGAAAAPSSSSQPRVPASTAAELLERIERALTSGEPLPDLTQLQAGDWRAMFESPPAGRPPVAAASAAQLQRLASEGGSETLADLLLVHTLLRLLQAGPQQQQGSEPAALPPALAGLLTELLRVGSLRHRRPAEFDATVLDPLRAQRPLGRAAAVHASLFYVATRQAQAHERELADEEALECGGVVV